MTAADLNNMVMFIQRSMFPYTPYDTGNLAASIGDMGSMNGGVGFIIMDANKKAPYGALLNEATHITYTKKDKATGQYYKIKYVNRHYMWVDNALDDIAYYFAMAFGLWREK